MKTSVLSRMARKTHGMALIGLGFLPVALVAAIILCSWSIAIDIRNALVEPVNAVATVLNNVRDSAARSGDAISSVLQSAETIGDKVSETTEAVGRIPTQLNVPAIRIPAAKLPVKPNVQTSAGIPRIRMDNTTVQMPTIPGFAVSAEGLRQVKTILGDNLGIVTDLNAILAAIPNLDILGEDARALGENVREIFIGLQRIGIKVLIIAILVACIVVPWFYATYLMPYYQRSTRWVKEGWKML